MENILVTAALPYVNGPLHIGHPRSTYIPADVFVRYHRLKGNNVVFVCGSDEYGTPSVFAAEQEGLTPEALVNKYHEMAQRLFAALNISFDHYSRTLNPADHELTQYIFNKLMENKYIFKEIVKEYYCPKCKKFLPDRYVRGTCPKCGATDQYGDYCEKCGTTFKVGDLKDARCSICKSAPELADSEHYIFKLSAFSMQLERFLDACNIKAEIRHYVLNWIHEGLRDWDIVRDLNWGVSVPDMPGKVFYVWFNAPIGYIAATKEWAEKEGKDWESFWKLDKTRDSRIVHFIGKDIVYHHCLFWPAILIGTGEFALPTDITVRGHVTLEGKKISKSRKWWILIDDYLKSFPTDYLRFYYSLTTPNTTADGDFNWKDFQERINAELLANIGNFIHRTLTFIQDKFKGVVPKPSKEDIWDVELKRALKKAVKAVDKYYASIDIDKAVKAILDFSQSCNQYFQKKEPWRGNAESTIYHCVNAIRSLAILLEPIIPSSAERIWSFLNLEGNVHKQSFDSANELLIQAGHKINKPEPLFKKIEDADIEKEIDKLQKL